MSETKELQLSIEVNGRPATTAARTLAGLLESLGFAGAHIATAVNGEFVPAAARAALRLAGGEKIEIVSPRQGG
jgi:sulfur carrier protein